jgi:hypothetical protein
MGPQLGEPFLRAGKLRRLAAISTVALASERGSSSGRRLALAVDAVRDARVSFSGAELERVRIEYNSVRLHAAIGASHPTTNTKTAATPCAPPAATACW